MRVKAFHDLDADTVTVEMTWPIGADPDRMADDAWQRVETAARRAQTARAERDRTPAGLRRTPVAE